LWLDNDAGDELLAQAADALVRAGEVERAAEAEVMRADLASNLPDQDAAFSHLDRAGELVEARGTSESKARVLANVSRLLMLAGDNDESIRLGLETMAMAAELGNEELRAHALNNIGTARASQGDPGGMAAIEESLEIAESITAPWDIGRGLINLASLVGLFGDLRRGRELHEQAEEVLARYGLRGGLRFLQGERVVDDYHLGNWDEALRVGEEFVSESRSHHYMETQVLSVRAAIRLARGDPHGALEDSESGLALARSAKDPQALYPVLARHARLLAATGRLHEARAVADDLIARMLAERPTLVWATCLPDLCGGAGGLERDDELRKLAERSRAIATPWLEAARAYLDRDFLRAADLFATIGSAPEEAAARLLAAEALAEQGRRPEANEQLTRAADFYRGVAAKAYLRRAESLLVASA
jgi:tetratricopeptide (TPR) repeat protein